MAKEKRAWHTTIAPYKESIDIPLPMEKRWKTASMKPSGCVENLKNHTVEHCYKQILQFAKRHHLESESYISKVVFERDYRECDNENSFTMHSFITPCFYWMLECDFAYYYKIEYCFHDCPYEAQIIKKLDDWTPYIPNRVSNIQFEPTLLDFYQRVLRRQDQQYIYLLCDNLLQSS